MPEYTYYKAKDFPLKMTDLHHLVPSMSAAFYFLINSDSYAIKGGTAACLLSQQIGLVNDIDICVPIESCNMLETLRTFSEYFFFTPNHTGEDVATLFWRSGDAFQKLEVCFCHTLPEKKYVNVNLNGQYHEIAVVSPAWLLVNKLEKLARNYSRPIAKEKMQRHAEVAISMNTLRLECGQPLTDIPCEELFQLIKKSCERVSLLNQPDLLVTFQHMIQNIYPSVK